MADALALCFGLNLPTRVGSNRIEVTEAMKIGCHSFVLSAAVFDDIYINLRVIFRIFFFEYAPREINLLLVI